MLSILIVALGLTIIIRDFQTHRISNFITFIFLSLLLCDPHFSNLAPTIAAIFLVSTAFYLSGVGMGDIKLLVGLIAIQGELVLADNYVESFLAVLAVTVFAQLLIRGNLKGSVAFAHVILAPFLLSYLAI